MPKGGHNKGNGPGLQWLKAHVDYDGPDCLIWPFSKQFQGYGQVGISGKIKKAHRVMCELVNGSPPTKRHYAAHHCGKGHLSCVHPKHVGWKTPAENRADTFEHGTGNVKAPRRLTLDQVNEIRISELSCVDLAHKYKVSYSAIFKIKRGETWSKPRTKLTREKIKAIREAPEGQATAIGESLGINSATVSKLRSGTIFLGVE